MRLHDHIFPWASKGPANHSLWVIVPKCHSYPNPSQVVIQCFSETRNPTFKNSSLDNKAFPNLYCCPLSHKKERKSIAIISRSYLSLQRLKSLFNKSYKSRYALNVLIAGVTKKLPNNDSTISVLRPTLTQVHHIHFLQRWISFAFRQRSWRLNYQAFFQDQVPSHQMSALSSFVKCYFRFAIL